MRLQGCFTPEPDEAARLFHASLAKAGEQGAKLWELRTAVKLAELLRDRGDRDAARDVLKPVYDWFIEGWATEDLAAARALLNALG
jgi:Tfp pilus assembly protein FimV